MLWGVRVTPDGVPLKGIWPRIAVDGYIDATDLERASYDLDADMTEAWNVEVLRHHPFPVWPTEKFAPEQIMFHQIALEGYKIRWRRVPLVVCEYQEGGLTLGATKLYNNNPMGYCMMYNQNILSYPGIKAKFYNCIQMIALAYAANHLGYIRHSNSRVLAVLALVPGIILGIRRKRQLNCFS